MITNICTVVLLVAINLELLTIIKMLKRNIEDDDFEPVVPGEED